MTATELPALVLPPVEPGETAHLQALVAALPVAVVELDPDGLVRGWRVRAASVSDVDGQVGGVVALLLDVTEQQRLARQLGLPCSWLPVRLLRHQPQ